MRPKLSLFATLVSIVSATPIFPVARPFIPSGSTHVVARTSVYTTTNVHRPTGTIVTGSVPTSWRYTHGTASFDDSHVAHFSSSSTLPEHTSISAKNVTGAAHSTGIAVEATKTSKIARIPPELEAPKTLVPMTFREVCEKLCQAADYEPCGPCENEPDIWFIPPLLPPLAPPTPKSSSHPPSNSTRPELMTTRASNLEERVRAWIPLRHCLMQCLGQKNGRCEICNGVWLYYQRTLSPEETQSKEMLDYIEMGKCVVLCDKTRDPVRCLRCDELWNKMDRDLINPGRPHSGLSKAGEGSKKGVFRVDWFNLYLLSCFERCDPFAEIRPMEICRHCENFAKTIPPAFMRSW